MTTTTQELWKNAIHARGSSDQEFDHLAWSSHNVWFAIEVPASLRGRRLASVDGGWAHSFGCLTCFQRIGPGTPAT
jgi:hypothetical protein